MPTTLIDPTVAENMRTLYAKYKMEEYLPKLLATVDQVSNLTALSTYMMGKGKVFKKSDASVLAAAIVALNGDNTTGEILPSGTTAGELEMPLLQIAVEAKTIHDIEQRKLIRAAERDDEMRGGGADGSKELVEFLRSEKVDKADKAKDATADEELALHTGFQRIMGFRLDESKVGGLRSIGQFKLYCIDKKQWPSTTQIEILKLKSAAGGFVHSKIGSIVLEDNQIVSKSSEDAASPTNALGHVHQYALKLNTMLLLCINVKARPNQEKRGGGLNPGSDEQPQLAYSDTLQVITLLEGYASMIKHESMRSIIVLFDDEVRALCNSAEEYTFGAALVRSLPFLRQTLKMASAAAQKVQDDKKAETEKGADAKYKRQLEQKDREIANMKKKFNGGRGGYGGYGGGYNQNGRGRQNGRGNGGRGNGGRGNGGRGGGGDGGGNQNGEAAGGVDSRNGLQRMEGGNPEGPPCEDHKNGKCTRRFCSYSHA